MRNIRVLLFAALALAVLLLSSLPTGASFGTAQVVGQAAPSLDTGFVVPLAWERSRESDTINGGSVGGGISAGLSLATFGDVVWDNGAIEPRSTQSAPSGNVWASWPQRYSVDVRHFTATFDFPGGIDPSASGILYDPCYSQDIVPINDNLYVYVNGVQKFIGGTNYGAAGGGFGGETDGWYIPSGIQLDGFQPGSNVIDVITEERAEWGGLGYLALRFGDRPAGPDGSCGPPPLERAVIFIQGIDSVSGEPGECGQAFRDDVEWMRLFLTTEPWVTDRVNLDPARSFAYFSYAGTYPNTYCGDSYSQPEYGKADTCSGVAVAAEKLDVLINWMLVAERAEKVDLVAHSMGGMVASYWLAHHPGMRPKINSVVTFDSPLQGVPHKNALDNFPEWFPGGGGCDTLSQSWDDLCLNDDIGDPDCKSTIVPEIANVADGNDVPFFTMDATQKDVIPLNIQAVPGERTTLLSSDSKVHCKFDDDHGSAWRAQNTGDDLIGCWASMHWPPASGPTLRMPDVHAKAALVGCAVASLSASECIDKIGETYQPPAVLPGPSPAGSTELPIASEPFSVGNHIVINPGMLNEEENEVVGFASILLASPLQFDHEAGEPVVIIATSSALDSDGDGFTDDKEIYLGTDPLDACPDNTSDPAWPLDQNNDGFILVVGDVTRYTEKLFTAVTCPGGADCRLDLDANGVILVVGDVTKYTDRLFETCG